METKKFNAFSIVAFVMVVIMFGFSIYFSFSNRAKNGLSAYEMAIQSGLISKDMSEVEYLESLRGKDGTSVTLEDVYNAYLKEQNLTSDDLTYTEFILSYYPEKIVSDSDAVSLVESTTQTALRSTVDICYSYYMDSAIIYVEESNGKYYIDEEYENKYASASVSAGSGVIYQKDENTAYIITNYHVVYCSNYSNDSSYYVYYNETTGSYFTASYSESLEQTETVRITTMLGIINQTKRYISASDVVEAPLETHFLSSYGIYLYGYQSEKYEISASFVGGSAENDIAVLKVEKSASPNNELIFEESFKAVDIGDSTKLNEGQTIVAVGNPLLADTSNVDSSSGVKEYVATAKQAYVDALCLTSTSGEISNISESCVFESLLDSSQTVDMRLIRVSSAINAGNSGGGLYSTDGKLVGIVNGKIESESYDNVGYAIPINVAKRIADQIISQCDGTSDVTFKAVTTSALGIEVENGTSNSYYDSNSLTWNVSYQVIITYLSKSLTNSGLSENDIIKSIEINNQEYLVNNDYDVGDILLAVQTNDTSIKFNLLRYVDGDFISTSVEVNLVSSNFETIN